MLPNSLDSLYVQIKKDIMDGILSGVYRPEDHLPTESELSQKYGVSRITVSKAMTDLKESGIVIRYPGKGTFIAKNAVDILQNQIGTEMPHQESEGELSRIIMIIPMVMDLFFLSIVSGIQRALPPAQYQLNIVASNNAGGEAFAIKQSINSEAKGIILFPADQEYYSDEVLFMKINRFPFVLIDRPFTGIDTNYAISDNYLGGQIAARHLLDLGHKDIAFITRTNPLTYTVENRINGCKDEISKHAGCSFNNIYSLDVSKSHSFYLKEMEDLILRKKVTAFLTSESHVAMYLYGFLKTLDIRVPNDVSIITFDNPFSDYQDFMFFTHIDQHGESIGYEAGSIVRNILESQTREEPTAKKVIAPSLVISKSTAAPFTD